MIRIPESEVREKWDQTIDRVAESHEPVMIQRDGRDLVAMVPADTTLHESAVDEGAGEEPLWKQIVKIGAEIPIEEWEKLPTDMSINHDHYLYGSPKVDA